MQIIRTLSELRSRRAALTGRVAMAPTMGALHAGHMALVEAAHGVAEQVAVSIFVNPMQFGPNEDLSRYPRREAEDIRMLEAAGVAILWLPDAQTMYPPDFATRLAVSGVSQGLEGAARPGHFNGVATVVAKLFAQMRPDIAVFGEKDWQQLQVIRRMTVDLDLGIEIIGVPTMRDADGLALSSRNAYLSPAERKAAASLPRLLRHAVTAIERGEAAELAIEAAKAALGKAGFAVDYVELVDDSMKPVRSAGVRLLAAVRIGATRLIDNFPVKTMSRPH